MFSKHKPEPEYQVFTTKCKQTFDLCQAIQELVDIVAQTTYPNIVSHTVHTDYHEPGTRTITILAKK